MVRLLSDLLRKPWLINPLFAESQLPLIAALLSGSQVTLASDNKPVTNPYFTNISDYDDYGPKPLITVGANSSGTISASRWRSFDDAPKGSLAVIPVTGPILKYGGECGEPGSVHMMDWVKQASVSDRISGIIIRMDSPGGMVDGTASLADAIKESQKRTVGFIDDGIMASACMWIGSACNEIYASQKTDSAGSIGVYSTLYDFSERLKMLGITLHEIYAPQSTEKNKDYKEALTGNYALIQQDMKFICDQFIATIKTNRAGKLNLSAGDPFKGALYFAEEATAIGLIDGIKSFDQVVNDLLNGSSGSDSTPTKKSNSTSTHMFGNNFKKVAALKGKEASEISTEELQAANAELIIEGITGVVLGPDQTAVVAELESKLVKSTEENANLQKQVDELTAEVARLGKQAGDNPTSATKKEEKAEDPASEVKKFEDYDHNKAALKEVSGQ